MKGYLTFFLFFYEKLQSNGCLNFDWRIIVFSQTQSCRINSYSKMSFIFESYVSEIVQNPASLGKQQDIACIIY